MRSLTLFTACFLSFSALAQPSGTEFPNWTHTDIDGVEHTLYDYLDDGNTVVIDIFTTWCTNCIASLPALEQLQEDYGDDLKMFSFERDPSTSNEAEWAVEHNVTNPIFDDALATMETWNTTYQPNFFVICPDRSFELKSGSIASNNPLPGYVEDCQSSSTDIQQDDKDVLTIQSNFIQNELRFSIPSQTAQFRTLSLSGRIMDQGLVNGLAVVPTHEYAPGIYLLQVQFENEVVTRKFVKQ